MTSLLTTVVGLYNSWICMLLMVVGLAMVILGSHLVKKLVGLAIFQTSVILFYVSMGKVRGGTAPIFPLGGQAPDATTVPYTNPLPSVLMLTAIVVGIATTAVGLALAVRIAEAYGSLEEDDLQELDAAEDRRADQNGSRSMTSIQGTPVRIASGGSQ